MTSDGSQSEARAEAIALAARMVASSDDLIVRVRDLCRLLRRLDLDVCDAEGLATLASIDSEADAWPIGVDPELLDPEYRARCGGEMGRYGSNVGRRSGLAVRRFWRYCRGPTSAAADASQTARG